MGRGRGGRGKRARRSDLWSAEGTDGAGQRRGGQRGRSLPRQRPASAAVSSAAVSMGDGEPLAPLSHPLVKRLHRQAAERTLRTAVQHQEPERTAAFSRLRRMRLAKAGQASDSGDDPVPPAADIPDGEADVLPGLRKAVVARGQHLWESWGSSCAFAVAAPPTSALMGPADFAAMAVRLAGTARGSSYNFLAAMAVDSPDAEVDSTADSAKAAGGDEAGSALEDTTGHLVSGDGWPTGGQSSGQPSGQRRWASGALKQDPAGFVDLDSDDSDSGQQGSPSAAESSSSATVEFQSPAWAPKRRRR